MSVTALDITQLSALSFFLDDVAHQLNHFDSRPTHICSSDYEIIMVVTQDKIQLSTLEIGILGTFFLADCSYETPIYNVAQLEDYHPIDTSPQSSTSSTTGGSYEPSVVDDTPEFACYEPRSEEWMMDLELGNSEDDGMKVKIVGGYEETVDSDPSTSDTSSSDDEIQCVDA